MKNAILIPGRPDKEEHYDKERPSNSEDHWFSWLKRQLILKDILTVSIETPLPFRPRYDDWKKEFERYDITPETVLVGHSCGGGFLVRWLSENKGIKVDKVILVAPWINPENNPASDTADFFDFEIDSDLAERANRLVLFNSSDDVETIKKSVKIIRDSVKDLKYIELEDRGHFVIESMGGQEFPELLEEILS